MAHVKNWSLEMMKMTYLTRRGLLLLPAFLLALGGTPVQAQEAQTPEALIKQVSTEVLDALKADKAIREGDVNKIIALVNAKVMPHVDFRRMTASAVGRHWRQATPEQQAKLQEEFKILLVRTYSGALAQVKDQTIEVEPTRASAGDKQVVVKTHVRGSGDPIQLDYRLQKSADGWKIFDVNVLGVWLVQNYRNSFAQEIGANGIDGLIAKMAELNRTAATGAKS